MALGVVTPYFNLHANPHRFRAYEEHRKRIVSTGVQHVTVEIQLPDSPFMLQGMRDVIHLRTDSAKFHKTNCINIGAKALLDRGCKYIAWIDGDALLPNVDWPQRTEDALKNFDLVQLQSHIVYSGALKTPQLCLIASGELLRGKQRGHDGGGWAARAEFFEAVGYFDCVVSGANKALLTPFHRSVWPLGDIAYKKALDRYAEKAARYLRSVTFISQIVVDLNHGSRPRRKSWDSKRMELLASCQFDFERDCYYDRNGVIRWTHPDSPVAASVQGYLMEREGLQSTGPPYGVGHAQFHEREQRDR